MENSNCYSIILPTVRSRFSLFHLLQSNRASPAHISFAAVSEWRECISSCSQYSAPECGPSCAVTMSCVLWCATTIHLLFTCYRFQTPPDPCHQRQLSGCQGQGQCQRTRALVFLSLFCCICRYLLYCEQDVTFAARCADIATHLLSSGSGNCTFEARLLEAFNNDLITLHHLQNTLWFKVLLCSQ